MIRIEDRDTKKYFEAISENLLTDVCSRATLGQVGRIGGIYHLKAKGRTALLSAYLKLNTQLMDNRRAIG